ncbi:MAG: hypothetical protein JWM16_2587 [Verrucomicrobiales bacterium]|nr:hypothetical protein [Verrucomicrobiales bacterium]
MNGMKKSERGRLRELGRLQTAVGFIIVVGERGWINRWI